jgi:O-antigen ligase
MEILHAHWKAFLAAPWLGYGLGSFDAINQLVTTSENYPSLWNIHATHNVYLQWLEEGGILAALPMFLCIGALLLLMVRGARQRVRMTTLIRGLAAASLVFVIQGASDFALQIPSISALFAAILGLGVGLSVRTGRR